MNRISAMRFPLWARIAIVAVVVTLLAAASLVSWRWYTRPNTLTVAVGSLDGEAVKIVSALASRLASTGAGVRLRIVETPSAIEAAEQFASGKTDLAAVRGDVGDLSKAQAVVVLAHAVVLLVVPPGSPITDIAGLRKVTVGVVGGEVNKKIVGLLTDEYDLARAGVTFRNIAPADARRALDTKDVRAILLVMPLAETYLAQLRGLFPQSAKSAPTLIPIESAGAIAERERAFESFDIPKGTLRGSPPVPGDDVTTLRISLYLVAQKKLDNDLVTELTEALMKARRDLLTELPILGQMAAASTESDAFLPVHPGAATFYNGAQLSFLDKWGNAIFLAPMILGALASILAATWRFLRSNEPRSPGEALDQLYALGRKIRVSERESELAGIEAEIDAILQVQRSRTDTGGDNTLDVATLNVAAHRLENLVHDRRAVIVAEQNGKRDGEQPDHTA
jgi:TRAP-type uncharacterized transport system substrate-binding protein